jgi:aminopeptidase N
MGDFLALSTRAQGAQDVLVLQVLARQLAGLDRYYDGRSGQAAFRAFARARLAPAFARLGWDARSGEADNDQVLRTTLINTLGQLDDAAVVAEARRRFAAYLATPSSLTGSTREAVLRIVASHADTQTWEDLHRLARAATDVTQKTRIYHDLGLSHDRTLADRALALALSSEPSATDVPELISGVAEVYPDDAFAFALANRAKVDGVLEPTSRTTFYTRLATGSTNPGMPASLARFAASVPTSARGEVDRAIATIRYRLEIIAKRAPEMDRWLAANDG